MPAVRLSRRRRSSLATSFNPAKSKYYSYHSPSPRPVTFAPNVTPGTYVEPEASSSSTTPEPSSPTSKLFPPSELPTPAPSRRRVPPGKRRSLGYIPRPPNAFMLFRADFVRQKHVPGSIETNHGSLSKIIGNCWRALPLEEKHVWEVKAKHAKAEHKARYPEYRFRPVHNKNKDKKKEKPATTEEDELRCEKVAQLLLEGKKGDELAAAVRRHDRGRTENANMSALPHRRSSSVPLLGGITIPSLPFLNLSRSGSPMGSISRSARMSWGRRRSSSARPYLTRSWTMPSPSSLARDDSPLPEVDASLFEQSFLDASSNFSFPTSYQPESTFNFNEFLSTLPQNAGPPSTLDLGISPLDQVAPYNPGYTQSSLNQYQTHNLADFDALTWQALADAAHSDPSSAYSGSPALSEMSLPQTAALPLHAPQPQHVAPTFEAWSEYPESYPKVHPGMEQQKAGHAFMQDRQVSMGVDFAHSQTQQECSPDVELTHYSTGLENFFTEPAFSSTCPGDIDIGAGMPVFHDSIGSTIGFDLNDMIQHHEY